MCYINSNILLCRWKPRSLNSADNINCCDWKLEISIWLPVNTRWKFGRIAGLVTLVFYFFADFVVAVVLLLLDGGEPFQAVGLEGEVVWYSIVKRETPQPKPQTNWVQIICFLPRFNPLSWNFRRITIDIRVLLIPINMRRVQLPLRKLTWLWWNLGWTKIGVIRKCPKIVKTCTKNELEIICIEKKVDHVCDFFVGDFWKDCLVAEEILFKDF